jgi:hypothetical protein
MGTAAGRILFDDTLLADYFQIYLQDDGGAWSLPDDFSAAALRQRVTTGPHALLIHTARNMTVPLRVELHAAEPRIEAAGVQQVVRAGFRAPSGRLVVAGLTDDMAAASRLVVPAGPLGALVTFQGLDTLDEAALEGDDRYAVHLWPERVVPKLRVLRAYPGAGAGP